MSNPTLLHYVTCSFGVKGSWAAGYHTGIDYRAAVGTKVHVTRRGKVIHVGYDDAYGNYVIVQSWHKYRFIRHYYCHLSKFSVREGQRLNAGNVVGLSGDTGNTTAPHLHYEERHSPFGYYNHHKPVLVDWWPTTKRGKNKVRARIGLQSIK